MRVSPTKSPRASSGAEPFAAAAQRALAKADARQGAVEGVPTLWNLNGAPAGSPPSAQNERLAALVERLSKLVPGSSTDGERSARILAATAELMLDGSAARIMGQTPAHTPSSAAIQGGTARTQDLRNVTAQILGGRSVLALNYHNTSKGSGRELEELWRGLKRAGFRSVDEPALRFFYANGRWPTDHPYVMLNFFNGYRNHYDVAFKTLEKVGFKGWFYVPSGFVNEAVRAQDTFARAHTLNVERGEFDDQRLALSKGELREMAARGHAIASHTRTHSRLSADDPKDRRNEVFGSRDDLGTVLGVSAPAIALLGGAPLDASNATGKLLKEAGYWLMMHNTGIDLVTPAPNPPRLAQ